MSDVYLDTVTILRSQLWKCRWLCVCRANARSTSKQTDLVRGSISRPSAVDGSTHYLFGLSFRDQGLLYDFFKRRKKRSESQTRDILSHYNVVNIDQTVD